MSEPIKAEPDHDAPVVEHLVGAGKPNSRNGIWLRLLDEVLAVDPERVIEVARRVYSKPKGGEGE